MILHVIPQLLDRAELDTALFALVSAALFFQSGKAYGSQLNSLQEERFWTMPLRIISKILFLRDFGKVIAKAHRDSMVENQQNPTFHRVFS
jgi:hypothetical protein